MGANLFRLYGPPAGLSSRSTWRVAAVGDVAALPARRRSFASHWIRRVSGSGGNVRVRVSCSNTWECESRRSWLYPRSVSPSNSKLSAEVYILLSTEEK